MEQHLPGSYQLSRIPRHQPCDRLLSGEVEGADWIRTFSCVVQLSLRWPSDTPLCLVSRPLPQPQVPLRSEHRVFVPGAFRFHLFLPSSREPVILVGEEMLEDMATISMGYKPHRHSLGLSTLFVFGGMGSAPRHLLSLPNGLRFRELVFLLVLENDLRWIRELVLKCSDTLECLDVKYKWSGTFFGSVLEVSLITFVRRHPRIPSTSQKRQN
jgi:hypothetical protein